jgi:hypothetical protein
MIKLILLLYPLSDASFTRPRSCCSGRLLISRFVRATRNDFSAFLAIPRKDYYANAGKGSTNFWLFFFAFFIFDDEWKT